MSIKLKGILLLLVVSLMLGQPVSAITPHPTDQAAASASQEAQPATTSAETASMSAEELAKLAELQKEDITRPEDVEAKSEVLQLLDKRPISQPNLFNFMAYTVQNAIKNGVPANTIILILLLPLLATLIAFIKQIIGLPTMGIMVPIALAITLLATDILPGMILLAAILIGSFLSRSILKKIRIMYTPKMALSILVVAMFVFASLYLATINGILVIKQLSIFPVLLLIILSERIVSLQLSRRLIDTVVVTLITLSLGILGYYLLSNKQLQQWVLLYPEAILLLIPVNIAIGRYFGLRLTEYLRFKQLKTKS